MAESTNDTVGCAMEPNVLKMFGLSTAHISAATNRLLQAGGPLELVFFEKKDYGYLILVPAEWEESSSVPGELLQILVLASSVGCEWVMLDRDYDLVKGLPTFDW